MAGTTPVVGVTPADGLFTNIVKETMVPRIDYHMGELSPTFRKIIKDSNSVAKDDWGRNWIVKKTFRTGLAGAFRFGPMEEGGTLLSHTTDDALGSDVYPNFTIRGQVSQAGWPGPDASPSPGFFNWKFSLTKGKGNIFSTIDLRRIESLNATIGSEFTAMMDAAAEHVALTCCNSFFAEDYTGQTNPAPGTLAKFESPGSGTIADNSVNSSALVLTGGSIRRLADGQPVDLYHDDGGTWTRLNTGTGSEGALFVHIVDPLANAVNFINITGTAVTWPGSGDVYIVPHRAYTTAAGSDTTALGSASPTCYLPYGIESTLRSTGYLFGTSDALNNAIDLAQHPHFKSYVQSVGGVIDEDQFRRYISRCMHAYGGRYVPETFIMQEGVLNGIIDGVSGMFTIERNGTPLTLNQGYNQIGDAEVVFHAFGKKFSLVSDSFVGKGKVYGVHMRNGNWKKHVPPRLTNAATNQVFDQGLEFVAPLITGGSSIWMGVNSASSMQPGYVPASQITNQLQAPFYYPYQIMPDVIPGMKLTDVQGDLGPVNS
jgi:hypothetical protein